MLAPETVPRWAIPVACGLIVCFSLVAYHNSFGVPFLLDDSPSIASNPTIRHLWPVWDALMPPRGGGLTVEGRPLLNFSLAINYAIGGVGVWSYHALNLAIHIFAGFTLFGIVRRTFGLVKANRLSGSAGELLFALTTALLWTLHPLQTESVTYIVQRAESLAGLLLLLTLYSFIRSVQTLKRTLWLAFSAGCCLAGMAAKEVMVVAPVIVLLFDYTFLAGSLREAWRKRRGYYMVLASTWLLLAWFVLRAGSRGGTIRAGSGVAWWGFALTQSRGLIHYLALSVWPRRLIFDYGTDFVANIREVVPYLIVDTILLIITAFALRRRSIMGFLGACFFILLAPSSSFVGGTRQMLAEHRMYLALAPVVILVMLGVHALLGRRGFFVGAAGVIALGWATVNRNAGYHDALTLWQDTVAKRPGNAWAQNNLGLEHLFRGHQAEAEEHFATAIQLDPKLADAYNNLGNVWLGQGRVDDSIFQFDAALRLAPRDPDVQDNLANALLRAGRFEEAMIHYQETIQLRPDRVETYNNFGNALAQAGRPEEAIEQYEQALRLDPAYVEVHNNWGNVLLLSDRVGEAIVHYQTVLQLKPDNVEAHFNLGNALVKQGRVDDAISHYKEAVRLRPDHASAHANLANGLLRMNRISEAIPEYEIAVKIAPQSPSVRYNYANALAHANRTSEAIEQLRAVLMIQPDFSEALTALAHLQSIR